MRGEASHLLAEAGEIQPIKKRRIGVLSYRSDPKIGGQGVYVDYLTRALVERGHEVTVISSPPYPNLDTRVNLVQLDSLDLYAKPHNGNLALRPHHLLSATDTYEYFGHLSGKFVEPYTFGQRVYKYLKKNRDRFDVLLDNQTLAEGVLRVQEGLNLPLVTMIHHPITQDRRLALSAAQGWRHRWLVRRWYAFHRMQIRVARKLSQITCPSTSAKQDIVTEFGVAGQRIQAIPLGVDRGAFRPRPDALKAPQRLISTASADTPLKGLPILLEAYHGLLRTYPDLELVIIGKLRDGKAKLLLNKLGLQDRVTFRSGLSRDDLALAFNEATIAITPSLYEGFGLPAAEAMSCGTPVIVTDGGALPEVAGQAGVIVPRGEAAPLAAAIANLLDHPEERARVAQACLERAETVFDWAAIAPRYEALFEEAIARAC